MATKTKGELLTFIASKVKQNGTGAITGQSLQDAMNETVNQMWGVDLASTTEQLTNEIFDGKPVYAKCYQLFENADGNHVALTDAIPYDSNAWLDFANSFYVYSDGDSFYDVKGIFTASMYPHQEGVTFEGINSATKKASFRIYHDVSSGVYAWIYARIKYTKQ